MLSSRGRAGRCSGQRGIVGFNLALTIAFALFAVIELSRVTLAAKQIDDRVKVIVAEVGPGSNVSRLDETQKLNEVAQRAEAILAAAQPLSGQAQEIIETAESIDGNVANILGNATDINGSARSINSQLAALLPVVRNINGDGSFSATAGGVGAINMRADRAMPPVGGIRTDLNQVSRLVGLANGNPPGTIHGHVNSINCSTTVQLLGAPPGCGLT